MRISDWSSDVCSSDLVDPGAGDGMMMPTGAWVALGEDDAVATHLVDRADMLSVRSHHLHMLRHAAQRLALVLAPLAPTAEFLLELGLMFTTIFIIVAIKLLHLPLAPFRIVAVVNVAIVAPIDGRSEEHTPARHSL